MYLQRIGNRYMELNPEVLYRNSHRLVSQVSLDFKRDFFDRIN